MLSRRQWIGWSLAASAGLAGGLGCGDPPSASNAVAATFEPSPTGALIAVHSPFGQQLEVVVADDDSGEVVAAVGVEPVAASGYTAVAAVEGLAPGRRYRYWLELPGGERVGDYLFSTAPDPGDAAGFTFLFGADIDPRFSSPIFDTLAAAEGDFFLCLGDAPYADNAPGARTLEEYRARHADFRGHPAVQALHRARAWVAIYDDHELRNDWDAHFRAVEAARIDAGLRAWDEWFPLRERGRRYRSLRWGSLAEIFVLDCRLHRSANADPDGPDKTMLGAEQRAWLLESLAASAAPFKLVATSVPLDYGQPADSWQAFARERDELLAEIAARRIATVVFLTADQHWMAAHHLPGGFKELQVGPIARDLLTAPPRRPEEVAREHVFNFGEVRVTGGDAPALTLRARDELGRELYAETVRPGVGRLSVAGAEGRRFRLRGAHTFFGAAPAAFDYAPAGPYRLDWLDADGEPSEPDADRGELPAGGELALGV